MQLEKRENSVSDHEVSICGPTHEGGWCKYCQAVKQAAQALAEERESCARLAEFMIDTEDEETDDWKEGFYTACMVLSVAIRARAMEESDLGAALFPRIKDSALSRCQERTVPLQVVTGGKTN